MRRRQATDRRPLPSAAAAADFRDTAPLWYRLPDPIARMRLASLSMRQDFARPRLVLVSTPLIDRASAAATLRAALGAGDVATVIVDPSGRSEADAQTYAEELAAVCRDFEVPCVIAEDTRLAGRAKADGIHLGSGDLDVLRAAMDRFAPRLIVGASGFSTRHEALEAGELLPDYVLFGRIGAPAASAPDPADLVMAEWWAEIVEVPCIVAGGADIETLPQAISTGAEFVALADAVFAEADPVLAASRVARANTLLDEVSERLAA